MLNNIFAQLPADLSKEVFETLLQQPLLRVERIISKGHVSPTDEWYDQAWDEWVILLQGQASLRFMQAEDQHLSAGDFIYLPAHTLHQVTYTSSEQECIWLAIHFSPISN
jgi:cupin 2 domain-containing protein